MNYPVTLQCLLQFQQIVLAQQRPDWFAIELGMCANFDRMIEQDEAVKDVCPDFGQLVDQYAPTWDMWSGEQGFPVPPTRVKRAVDFSVWRGEATLEYHRQFDLYAQTVYGDLRRELLAHIIECVRADCTT